MLDKIKNVILDIGKMFNDIEKEFINMIIGRN